MTKNTLEICVDSVQSALIAAHNGASRLELCSNLIIGGTTPSTALIEMVKEQVDIPIHVLIRPRFGDFLYSHHEFEQIKREIIGAKKQMADGVVIGMTDALGHLDKVRLKELIDLARPMHVTLHRAFDVCVDPFEALEDAIALGFDTILTSGQQASAEKGLDLISKLIKASKGRIDIMPGAGINPDNLSLIKEKTGASSFHLSAKLEKESEMVFRKDQVHMGLPGLSEFTIYETDGKIVRQALECLNQ